jgi:hypothetical protein
VPRVLEQSRCRDPGRIGDQDWSDDVSDDLAGFIGDVPGWLPRSTQKARRAEAAREYREARDAALDQEQRAEAKRSAAMALYAQQAEQRGEQVSAFALATGQVPGRSAAEVLAAAAVMADREDAREAWRERREAGERLNFCFDSPPATRAESAEGREVKNVVRHYAALHQDSDVIDRARIASATRAALRRNRPVI